MQAETDLRQGHQASALKYLQAAAAKNSQSAVAEEAMGRYLDADKEYPAAEAAFKRAIVLNPSARQRKSRQGILIYRKARQRQHWRKIAPNNVGALNNLAWTARMSLERVGEALGYAKKAAHAGTSA